MTYGLGPLAIPSRRSVRPLEATGLVGACCSPGERGSRREMSEIREGADRLSVVGFQRLATRVGDYFDSLRCHLSGAQARCRDGGCLFRVLLQPDGQIIGTAEVK